MAKALTILAIAACVFAASPAWPIPSNIALTYVHHNEPEWQSIWSDQAAYLDYRDTLTQLVAGLVAQGAAIDIQVCAASIQADQRWSDGQLYLNLYAMNPEMVAIDPHAHDDAIGPRTPYNTADAAYLLSSIGLPDTGVVGGYLMEFTPNQNMTGAFYPEYAWQADILWGGSNKGHVNDPRTTGVMQVGDQILVGGQDSEHASPHTAGARLSYLQGLIARYPEGRLYTASFFIGVDLMLPGACGDWVDSVGRINAEAGSASYWSTIPGIVEDWRNLYNQQDSYTIF